MIIDYFIPSEEFRKVEKIAEWDDKLNDWTIRNPSNYRDIKTGSKRP